MNCSICGTYNNLYYLPCRDVICVNCLDPSCYNSKHIRRCPHCTNLYMHRDIVAIEKHSLICKRCGSLRPRNLFKPCKICGMSYEIIVEEESGKTFDNMEEYLIDHWSDEGFSDDNYSGSD